ncbi:MAG: 6-phosphogluconolactonase [Oscillospiraceae bacterium]|nr:6-phosphogluconolactonase [Oscillospiraceae bacterium]
MVRNIRSFLKTHIFDLAPFAKVHYLNGAAEDIDAECERYAALLREEPIDIVFMGIGENGHIAFNDPGEADFSDPYLVRRVKLDDVCRMQQVHDGCFPALDAVPQYALTLTVPMLQSADHHFCMVPSALKAEAVYRTLYNKIDADCPATIIRLCKDMRLFLDKDSAKLI